MKFAWLLFRLQTGFQIERFHPAFNDPSRAAVSVGVRSDLGREARQSWRTSCLLHRFRREVRDLRLDRFEQDKSTK